MDELYCKPSVSIILLKTEKLLNGSNIESSQLGEWTEKDEIW